MEPKGYELLKIETKIDVLEKELSALFADFKKYESTKETWQSKILHIKNCRR